MVPTIEQARVAVAASAARAGEILEHAATNAPRIADSLPAQHRAVIERGRVQLTTGVPRFTWNGLDGSGRLFPGLHPATAGEVELRFAWNPERRRMYERALIDLTQLREEHPQARHVVGAGSFFGTDKPNPGDIDVAVLGVEDVHALQRFTRQHAVTHVYPAEARRAGIPNNILRFFATDRAHVERGMVLLDLDELLGSATRASI